MWTLASARDVMRKIHYKNWGFHIIEEGNALLLQIQWYDTDFYTKSPSIQSGRRWFLERTLTESELVQTVWLAIQTAEEHEMREQFTYAGRRIYMPHMDVQALIEVVDAKRVDYSKVK